MSLVLGSGHSDGPNKSNSQGDAKCKIVRKNANFHPSVWGNHFITSSPDDLKPNPQMQQRASELKEEVKKMLGNVKNCSLKEINMIDAIQRLGVACHFEKEMADALLRIYNEDTEGKYESDDDLHAVALRFRLLRQEGYCVSTNAVDEFEEELALEEKSYRISFLKDAFKEISKYFLIEAQWFNTGYVPTYEEYMNVALITCGYKLLTLISFVGMGDIATTEAFEWARSMPKLIKAVSIVNRLRDDITSNKMEQERGHVVSSIEVYMKEYGGTYEETCTKFREMVADAWKDINEECLKPMAFPMALLIRPVNFARVMEVLYQHRDEYTESTHETKERISMVLVNRIPV